MRVKELFESIEFVPTKLNADGIHDSPMHDVEEECWTCDGTGTYYDRTCDHCNGTKVLKRKEWSMPHMQLSNGNAYLLMSALGLEEEPVGVVPNKDLPELKRKLLKLLNTDVSKHTRAPSITQDKHTKVVDVDGVSTIKRYGPTMIDHGVSSAQIKGYAERMIKLVDAAQKEGYDVSWA